MEAASLKKQKKRRLLLVRCSENAAVGAVAGAAGGEADGKAEGGGSRDWSSLPEPAVCLILMGLLPALADAFSLGSVCRAWRSVFTACKRELFLALPPLLVDRGSSSGALGGFYSLKERRFCRRKQPISWRWVVDDSDFCLSDTNVVGVSHGDWIVLAESFSRQEDRLVFLMDPLSPEVRIDLPRAPHDVGFAFMTAPPASPDCVVVATDLDRILYCRPGDTQWARHCFKEVGGHDAPYTGWKAFQRNQVAVLGRQVYALARDGKLVIMELLFPRPRLTVVEAEGLPQKHNPLAALLVESDGEILYIADERRRVKLGPDGAILGGHPLAFRPEHKYVVRRPDGAILGGHPLAFRPEHKYVVRRLDLPVRQWVTVNTLGDRCLFLNRRGTSLTCVGTKWMGGGDRIYSRCVFSESLLVFHMKDGTGEHHPMPKECPSYDWLIPSFCYR